MKFNKLLFILYVTFSFLIFSLQSDIKCADDSSKEESIEQQHVGSFWDVGKAFRDEIMKDIILPELPAFNERHNARQTRSSDSSMGLESGSKEMSDKDKT